NSDCLVEGTCAAANIAVAKLTNTNLETIAGLPNKTWRLGIEYLAPDYDKSGPPRKLNPAHLLKYTPNFVQETLFLWWFGRFGGRFRRGSRDIPYHLLLRG